MQRTQRSKRVGSVVFVGVVGVLAIGLIKRPASVLSPEEQARQSQQAFARQFVASKAANEAAIEARSHAQEGNAGAYSAMGRQNDLMGEIQARGMVTQSEPKAISGVYSGPIDHASRLDNVTSTSKKPHTEDSKRSHHRHK